MHLCLTSLRSSLQGKFYLLSSVLEFCVCVCYLSCTVSPFVLPFDVVWTVRPAGTGHCVRNGRWLSVWLELIFYPVLIFWYCLLVSNLFWGGFKNVLKRKKGCHGGRTNHYLCSGLLSVNTVLVAMVRRWQTRMIFIMTSEEEVWISGFQFHDFDRRCNKYTCI